MKLIASAVLLLLSFSSIMHAQDEDDYEQPHTSRHRGGIVGAGGGVTPTWYWIRTSTINTELAKKSFPALSGDGMFIMGGQGYAYLPFVPNLRIGGIGAGGSLESSETRNGIYRSVSLKTNFGGINLEYVFPFGRFHAAIGGVLAAGSQSFILEQTADGPKQWDNVLDPISPGTPDTRHEFSNVFFSWQPAVTAEFDVNPFIVAGLTGGYYGTSGSKWKVDGNFDLNGLPDLELNGYFLRLTVTVGLFLAE